MPQRRTAIKDLRKNHTRHLHNLQLKTDLKKTVKKFLAATADKKEDANVLLKDLYKKFDKAAKRNVVHKKTAARRKSRYAKLLAAPKQA
jgi:small subunit ribosomal protein S20